MYPTNQIQMMPLSSISIKPGDKITDTVIYNSSTKTYTLEVSDLTNKQSDAVVTTCASGLTCSRKSAEWIVERPFTGSNYAPLGDWGTMNFTDAEAAKSTTYAPISRLSYHPINMINTSGASLANPSSLSSTGNNFTDNWIQTQ